MDRRDFLAAGGWTAALSALPMAADASTRTAPAHFSRVDCGSDGLGLDSREYLSVLQTLATAGDFEPDYYSLGGAVEVLERRFAKALGKEAAMFVPTGTLANHLAVRQLAGSDRRVLVQAESHLYADSGDGAAALSGLTLVPLAPGATSMPLADIEAWLARTASGRVAAKIGVISMESPVRRRQQAMVPFAELQAICALARTQGIRLHLDGARLFNLPQHSGHSVQEYTALFDTVYVSLWKHFNAASGAILAGDAAFIDGLFHVRRQFGGALPHAWPAMAPAAAYLDDYVAQYANAWIAAEAVIGHLQATGRFSARKVADGTSVFHLIVEGGIPAEFAERLRARGVRVPPPHPETGELALQVNATWLRKSPDELSSLFVGALSG